MPSRYFWIFSSSATGSVKLKWRKPSPRSAASKADEGWVPAIHMGGCGFCSGLGTTLRVGIFIRSLSHENSSCVHIFGIIRIASSHSSRFVSGSTPKGSISKAVAERPVPNSSRPLLTISSIAARSATRIGWLYPNGSSTTPWPIRMRDVCWLTAARKTSGADEIENSPRK